MEQTMETKILKITGLSLKEYELLLLEEKMASLSKVAFSMQHLQLLLIDMRIDLWFCHQLSKINKEYLKLIKPFERTATKYDFIKLYKSELKKLSRNYPGALISNINPKNHIELNN